MVYGKQTYKGKFVPKRPEKYVGDITNIIYRSGLERKFMAWCDTNPHVKLWSSETLVIPYVSPVDDQVHRYFVDFIIQIENKNGQTKTYAVEVKPYAFTKAPTPGKRKTKQFLAETVQYRVNQAKWNAATAYCKPKGWTFIVITEKDLGQSW